MQTKFGLSRSHVGLKKNLCRTKALRSNLEPSYVSECIIGLQRIVTCSMQHVPSLAFLTDNKAQLLKCVDIDEAQRVFYLPG